MSKDLANFWDNSVDKGWKHFVSSMPKDKINRLVFMAHKHFYSHINYDNVSFALDWGCGGGLLAKELSNHCDVGLIDLSRHSIDEAHRYIGRELYAQVLPSELSKFDYHGPSVDMVHCHAVSWHFPSYEYWTDTLNIWGGLNPEYIALQTKQTTKLYSSKKGYFQGDNYLEGLLLSHQTAVSDLKDIDYELAHYGTEQTSGGVPLGYYVFRKKL